MKPTWFPREGFCLHNLQADPLSKMTIEDGFEDFLPMDD